MSESGWWLTRQVLPPAECEALVHELTSDHWPWHHKDSVGPDGGRTRDSVLDGYAVAERLPILTGIYHGLTPFLRIPFAREVIPSPYPRSGVNVLDYPPGGTMEPHRDTNPVQAVLHLNDDYEGGRLVLNPDGGPQASVKLATGELLVFPGRLVEHSVEEIVSGHRFVVTFNYYYPDDTWRPDWVDATIYDDTTAPVSWSTVKDQTTNRAA